MRYWHITHDPNFQIDPTRGPTDLSSLVGERSTEPGFMFTDDPHYWASAFHSHPEELGIEYENESPRLYAAEIDPGGHMGEPNSQQGDWWPVQRGFGSEFYHRRPDLIKVKRILPLSDALKEADNNDIRLAKKGELHVGLGIPKPIAIEIHNWAEEQDWPEGTELEPLDEYHITMLFAPERGKLDEDGWNHESHAVSIKGITSFPSKENGPDHDAIVLIIESETIHDHHKEFAKRAEDAGIEISAFSGEDFKPHLTIAYGKLPKGLKPPKLTFETEPSEVSPVREHDLTKLLEGSWEGYGCGQIWINEKKKRIIINVGDGEGDKVHRIRQLAKQKWPEYDVETEAEIGFPGDGWKLSPDSAAKPTKQEEKKSAWRIHSNDDYELMAKGAEPYEYEFDRPNDDPHGRVWVYHSAPTEDRARIRAHGLIPSLPELNPQWEHEVPLLGGQSEIYNEAQDQPKGIYVSRFPRDFSFLKPTDVWRALVDPYVLDHDPIFQDTGEEGKHFVYRKPIGSQDIEMHEPYESHIFEWPKEKEAYSSTYMDELKKFADSWVPKDQWPNALRERNGDTVDADCTCKDGHKLDCPVHGMHPVLPDYKDTLEFRDPSSPVGYDYHTDGPRTWMRAETKRHNIQIEEIHTPIDKDHRWEERRPLIYYVPRKTVYMGSPGSSHSQIYEHLENHYPEWLPEEVHEGIIGKYGVKFFDDNSSNNESYPQDAADAVIHHTGIPEDPNAQKEYGWNWDFQSHKRAKHDKLWVDDTRRPPDNSWDWARNVAEAIELTKGPPGEPKAGYDHMSLDHDLGIVKYEGKVVVNPDAMSGGDFVMWLHEHGNKKHMPKSVNIHSHNKDAAELMRKALEPHCEVTMERAPDELEEDWAYKFKVHEPSEIKKEEIRLPEKPIRSNIQSPIRVVHVTDPDWEPQINAYGEAEYHDNSPCPVIYHPPTKTLFVGEPGMYHHDLVSEISKDYSGRDPSDVMRWKDTHQGRLRPPFSDINVLDETTDYPEELEWDTRPPENHEEIHKLLGVPPYQGKWNFIRSASHQLAWLPGSNLKGKGLVTPNGDIHTWPVDDEGMPHHAEYVDKRQPYQLYEGTAHFFQIRPRGGLDTKGYDIPANIIHHVLQTVPSLRPGEHTDWHYTAKINPSQMPLGWPWSIGSKVESLLGRQGTIRDIDPRSMKTYVEWTPQQGGWTNATSLRLITASRSWVFKSAEDSQIMYHVAPTTERDRIATHGLYPTLAHENNWPSERQQPLGVYLWKNPQSAEKWRDWSTHGAQDIWRVEVPLNSLSPDEALYGAFRSNQHIRPENLKNLGMEGFRYQNPTDIPQGSAWDEPEFPARFKPLPEWKIGRPAKTSADQFDTREYPDTRMMPPTTMQEPVQNNPHPEKQGCTCDEGKKLDCPIHGMNPIEQDIDHSWSIPENFPVGYPQDQPRNYIKAEGKVFDSAAMVIGNGGDNNDSKTNGQANKYGTSESTNNRAESNKSNSVGIDHEYSVACDCPACQDRREHEWHMQGPGTSGEGWSGLPRAEGAIEHDDEDEHLDNLEGNGVIMPKPPGDLKKKRKEREDIELAQEDPAMLHSGSWTIAPHSSNLSI